MDKLSLNSGFSPVPSCRAGHLLLSSQKKSLRMASGSTYRPPFTTRQLLVSVQSADEAELAFQAGVPWVDLKNPSAGSLGAPTTDTCVEFLAKSSSYPDSQISVALGEVVAVDWTWVADWLPGFAVGKVGLAGQSHIDDALIERLSRFEGAIVPAAYADWQRAGCPTPEAVARLAIKIHAPFLLIDTFIKDGSGLFEWLTIDQLKQLQASLAESNIDLVIAGSLRTSDWAMLTQLHRITIGVRGAVCETQADRSSRLSPTAIAQWLQFCSGSRLFDHS